MKTSKPLLFVACSLPLAWLAMRAFGLAGHGLGANPISELIHQLGLWGLRLLLLTLCVTPLTVTLRKPKLLQYRRMLGLFSFTYLALHFLTWLVLDQSLRPAAIVADIVKRPYITVGFAALSMLVAARRHLDEEMDAPARPSLASPAPADLSGRDPRMRAFLVAGQGGLARAARLRGRAVRIAGLALAAREHAAAARRDQGAAARSLNAVCAKTEPRMIATPR